MYESGMIAEIRTFVDLLGACARQAEITEGQWIHSILVTLALDTDVTVVNTLIHMYGKLGSLEDAWTLFDKMLEKSSVSWASMIASYAHCGCNEQVVECFHVMHEEKASFDNVVFIHLLGACAREEFLCDGQVFHASIAYKGFDSDNMVSNAIINMYCKCGDLHSAKRVFDMMDFRDAVSWNTIVTAYAQNQNWTEALQCLAHMKWEGVKPDEITFVKVLSAGANTASDADVVRRVHQCTIVDGGFEASMAVISALVNLYGKWGMLEDAQILFDSMPEKNTEAWNAMILGYMQQGRNAEAVQIFLQMQTERVHLENSVYVATLNAFASPSDLLHGKCLHACIISAGLLSEVMVSTALLSMYGRCGSLEDAFALFSIMEERDEVSWNVAMGVFLESESHAWVLQLFQRMLGEAVLPNFCTIINVLQTCTWCDAIIEGKRLHACVSHGSCKPDIGVTNTLLSMYGESSELENLHRVFNECPECDTISWNVIIKALVHAGHSMEGLQKSSQMQAEGYLPDVFTFVNVLDACGSLGTLSQGKSVHSCVIHSGLSHVTVNNALLNMYSKCGHLQDALEVFTDMPERNGASWSGIISAHCQWADGRKVFELFERVLAVEHPDFRTFACFLCACATREALFEGKLLHKRVTCLGYDQEVLIGNALINMYGKCGNYKESKAVFENMCEKSVVTWNTMMTVDSFHGLQSERSLLFDAMSGSVEIIPNKTTFMSLLETCASLGASTRGRLLHMYITGSGLEADLMVTTSLVCMYGKLGFLEDALKVSDNATSKSLFTWNAAIAAHMYHGHSKEALLLSLRLQHEGHMVDGTTVASVITACSHAGDLGEGQFLLHILINNLTDMKHLDCAIDLFGRTGQVIQAENLIFAMPVQPTIIAWTALLSASRDLGDVVGASCAASHVIELEPGNTASHIILSSMQLAVQLSER